MSYNRLISRVLILGFALCAGIVFHPTDAVAQDVVTDKTPPIVVPPPDLFVGITGTRGARVAADHEMTAFLAGGKAKDDLGHHPVAQPMQRIVQVYSSLPLRFERNEGQADPRVKFLARGGGYTLLLTPTEMLLGLRHTVAPNERQTTTLGSGSVPPMPLDQTETVMLGMKLVGNNPAPEIAGFRELPGKVNYYIGNDRTKWRTHVSTFEKVVYKQAYPGIDLVFYGNQGRLEYDFIVAPGANPSAIALAFEGAEKMEINSEGDLVVGIRGGEVLLHKPAIYQEAAGKRQPVRGGFVVEGGHKVSFELARYDTRKPLIIDPDLLYSTYLGGTANDQGLAIAADNAGNAYVTGFTLSTNFPVINFYNAPGFHGNFGLCGDNGLCDFIAAPFGPNGGSYGPVSDAFVAKIDTTKSGVNSLIYSTYLGGGPATHNPPLATDAGTDQGNAIAVDASGNAYVAGNTTSQDFPTTGDTGIVESDDAIPDLSAGCISQLLPCTVNDAFLSKFNPSGALVYSTQFGGQLGGGDSANGIAVDNAGNAYMVGNTTSIDFPITLGNAFQTTFSGIGVGFITKIDTTQIVSSSLVYSSFFGTNNSTSPGLFGTAIALDSANNVYVTGKLNVGLDTVPTTPGALQSAPGSGFVAKFDLTKSGNASLVYSTYFPASPSGIAVDKNGNAYITGIYGNAPSFPLTTGAYDSCVAVPSLGDCAQGVFVSKLNATGSALIYSARLGGFSSDFSTRAGGIAVDSNSNAYITGSAAYNVSTNGGLTVAAPFPGNLLVGDCLLIHCFAGAYVTMLNPQGASIVYSNILSTGSSGCDNGDSFGHGVAVDSAGNAYFAGATCLGNVPSHFPTTANAFQNTIGSSGRQLYDAYVVKLGGGATPAGTGVTVQPIDNGSRTSPVTMTFANVTQVGTTTLTISAVGPAPPLGFALGTPPLYYELATTAVFSGSVKVCINYTGVTFITNLPALFHFQNAAWTDVTIQPVDTVNKIICGTVTSLSPFAIFQGQTVNTAALSVTAANAARTYGAANPVFTGTITGIQNGDNITATYTSAATAGSPVGTYTIVPKLVDPGNKLGNYTVTSNNGTLTITSASLAIAANSSTRPYGTNNPALTGSVAGLQNGDVISAIGMTAASPGSPVGAYPITPVVVDPSNRLGNYAVTILNGTLVVFQEPTSLSVTLSPLSIPVGQTSAATVTLTAPGMVIAIDPSVLAPITLTSPVVSDILSNNGVCIPVPGATPGVASCTVNVTSAEPNGRTLNASFAGSANLAASSGLADLIVTAALQSQQVCIASDFRNVAVPGGSYLWFNSIFKVRDVSNKQKINISFFKSTVQFQYKDTSKNVVTVNQAMPDARIVIDPNATASSTSFDTVNNVWITTIPWDLDDNSFLTGMPWMVPAGGIPADVEPVNWCGTFASDTAGIDIGWRWAAAAYSSFNGDNTTLGVKPMDTDNDNPPKNFDRAGTPENFKQFVIPGARGKGGKNYTGTYSRSKEIE